MIKTETIIYNDSETVFQGTICYDDEISGKNPGILVAPTIRGHTDFEVEKAVELAKLGYVGFVVDMYGKDTRTENADENRAMMNELNANRPLLLQRIKLALETLKNHEQVDENKLGGIGFCFGGKCVLDLVRANEEINGVVSFHGVYDKPPIGNDSPIKSSVLILHGWDDPLGTPPQLVDLAEELTMRQADWQILSFGKTGHSFTYPKANSPESGLIYNELSDRRAWLAMKIFFAEIFEKGA
jgi:dienelactone hydrolase